MRIAVDSIVGEPFQISWNRRIRNCLDAFIPKSMGFSQYPSCCQPIFSGRHFSDQKRRSIYYPMTEKLESVLIWRLRLKDPTLRWRRVYFR